jgi:putative Holliday junction resolvase
MARVLAVDPGEVRIGLAISDPTGTIARPLLVLRHTARRKDALRILDTAAEYDAGKILVGIALNMEGKIGPQARKALRLVETLRSEGNLPVLTWDESGSTHAALRGQGRDPMLDARAAAVFLQEFLNAQKE